MNYSITYYSPEKLSQLETIWKNLEKGQDMTYFQSYNWYTMLNNCYVPQDTSDFTSIFAVVKRDNEAILIAPLWVVFKTFKWVNKKGIYFLGREGWSDYLNFIYKDFDSNALMFLLKSVVDKYKVHSFKFSELKESALSYRFLQSCMNLGEGNKGICVALELPDTLESYSKMLSKNARQNIRTAHNRLKKDGKEVRFVFDDKDTDKELCRNMREQRWVEKFKHISKLRLLKYRIMHRLTFHFKPYLPFICYNDGHFLTTYIDNKLSSFFFYLIDDEHRQISVIAAGVDLQYSRYSPGIISLNAFINKMIEEKQYDIIDFTRGDEPYKYTVGGQNHFIVNADFKL